MPSQPALPKRRWYSNVAVIASGAVGLGLLACVASLATAGESAGALGTVVQRTWLLMLILTLPYLAARALVWRGLLVQLGLITSWRALLMSLTVGEVAKYLPAGVYVQNYLLARVAHFDQRMIARSAMATTAVLGLESFLAFPVVVLVGLPHAPWLSLALTGLAGAWVVVLVLVWIGVRRWSLHLHPRSPSWLRRLLVVAEDFLQAGRELISVRTIPIVLSTAAYMLVRVIALNAIIVALGIQHISLVETAGIYTIIVLASRWVSFR